MDWLGRRTNDGAEPLTTEELKDFRFRGAPLPLMDMQRGIRKPAVLDAALELVVPAPVRAHLLGRRAALTARPRPVPEPTAPA